MKILYHIRKLTPLLFDYYPGAAVGYSVRKLDKDYKGYCMEVRRSSDNVTKNIGFVNNALNETSLLNFVGSGNGYVRTWYDQSGNGNNAVQPSEASQPTIVVSGSILKDNNKPAVYFNGISNYMPMTTPVEADTDFSTFSVIHRDTGANYMFIFTTDIPSYVGPYSAFQFNATTYCCNTKMSSYYAENIFEQVLYSTFAVSYVNYMFKNSVSKTLLNPGGTFPNDIDVIGRRGGTYYAKGYIQEGIWYQSDQMVNREGVESNINTFFSIFT